MSDPAYSAKVLKRDGTETTAMTQETLVKYLGNQDVKTGSPIIRQNQSSYLNQCIGKIFDGGGKATAAYMFATGGTRRAVQHASSGDGQDSATIFWMMQGAVATVIAVGEYVPVKKLQPVKYKITGYGQAATLFAEDCFITL